MSLHLPPELHWLSWVVGSDWPEGDEDAMARCAQAWTAAGRELRELLPDAETAGMAALSAVDGDVAVALRTNWNRFTVGDDGYLEQLAKACDELAKLCDGTAVEIEYAKYQFIIALIALAITIATLIAATAGTLGASAAGIPVAEAATQSVVRIIAWRLIRAIALGAAENVAMDVAAQVLQLVYGHRKDWDWHLTAAAAEDGAIFGAGAGGIHLGGTRFAPGLADSWRGHLLSGFLTGGAGAGATALAHGQPLSGTDFLKSLTAGMVEGGFEHHPLGDSNPSFDLDLLDGHDVLPEQISRDYTRPDHTDPLADHLERTLGNTPPDPASARESSVDGHDASRGPGGSGRVELVGSGSAQLHDASPHVNAGAVDHDPASRTRPSDGPAPAPVRIDPVASPAQPGATGPANPAPSGSPGTPSGSPGTPAGSPGTPAGPPAASGHSMAPPAAGGSTHVDLGTPDAGRTVGGDRTPPVGPGRLDPPGSVGAGVSALAPPTDHRAPSPPGPAAVVVTPLYAGGAAGHNGPPPRAGDLVTPPDGGVPVLVLAVTDAEALALVREHLVQTQAGYAFYPAGDEFRRFAEALPREDGYVTLDLHGSNTGFHIDGRVLTPEQFADAIRTLGDEGRLHIPEGHGFKLASCDVGIGDSSPAARLARASGVDVKAPTERLWTTLDGTEVVASAHLHDGRWIPRHPPDGGWRIHSPEGGRSEVSVAHAGSHPLTEAMPRSSEGSPDRPRSGEGGPDRPRSGEGGPDRPRSGEGGPDRPRSWADGFDGASREDAPKPADEVRERRAEARQDLDDRLAQSGRTIADLVAESPSLEHLLETGVRPDEIAHHLDETTLARWAPELDRARIRGLHEFFGDERVRDALRRSWDQSARGDSQSLAETLLRGLLDQPRLIDVMRSSDVLMDSLTKRPATMDSFLRHPRAGDVLANLVKEIDTNGIAAVLDHGVPAAEPTPLADWQDELSRSILADGHDALQPGFDIRRANEHAYVEGYLRSLYREAMPAQHELVAIADEIASVTGGEARYRPEPKRWSRCLDKIHKRGGDASRLTDLAAGSIEYRSLSELYQGLREITSRPDVNIVSFGDRFAVPLDSGYRDIQMTLRMSNGHIAELRLHLHDLELVAEWEHALYEVRRDLSVIAEADGRALTDQERAIRARLLIEAQRHYWDAIRHLVEEKGNSK